MTQNWFTARLDTAPGYPKLSRLLILLFLWRRRKSSLLTMSRFLGSLQMVHGKAHGALPMGLEPFPENWLVPFGKSCKLELDEENASKPIRVPFKYASWDQRAC